MFSEQLFFYNREPFTPWKIEVVGMDNEDEFVGHYRTTYRDGKECEQFTLLPAMHSDEVLVQVRMYKNGDILANNYVPATIVVYKRKKLITVELLCDISVTSNGTIQVSYTAMQE